MFHHRWLKYISVLMISLLPDMLYAQTWDVMSDTWVATDSLGRSLPTNDTTGDPRDGKFVGIFYFLWLGQHSTNGPYDISKLLAENPTDPAFGPMHAFHHWGESQFGYYYSDDDYVVAKHAHELAAAGVDTLIVDITNSFPYTANFLNLCEVYQGIRDRGGDTPKICFIAYNGAYENAVQNVYDNLYSQNLYPDIWFEWDGKPLLLSPSTNLSTEVLNFFTIRESWAWSWSAWFGSGQHKWPWLDDFPQSWGWDTNSGEPEEMAVAIASHPTRNIGRSFSGGLQPAYNTYGLTGLEHLGLFFEEQWSRAHAIDPDFIYVTGWNEWVAQRFIDEDGGFVFLGQPLPAGGSYFVDAYNQEYNRDIEPMKGGHTDLYYYQLVEHIRRQKGTRAVSVADASHWIDIDGQFDDWTGVVPEFRDNRGDAINRNHPGWGSEGTYINNNARNDIDLAKVARDPYNVHFYVRTIDPMTSYEDENWMLLLINADRNYNTGWEGYDYIINRTGTTAQTATLEVNLGGWNWAPAGTVVYASNGTELELTIPRHLLGDDRLDDFEFKWSDNMQESEVSETENTQYWSALNNVGDLSAPSGLLTFEITDTDPFVGSPDFSIDASVAKYITIRLMAPAVDFVQIFWHTAIEPYPTQPKSVVFPLDAANEFGEYVIDLSSNPEWAGEITKLRLDPTNGSTLGTVQVDYVRICSAPATGSGAVSCEDGIAYEFTPTDDRTMQFRVNGDAAPDLRYNYHFVHDAPITGPQRWDFNTNHYFEGWNMYQHTTENRVLGGLLKFTVIDIDPYMFSPAISVDAASVDQFIIRMLNPSVSTDVQLFWTNENGGPGTPGNDVSFTVSPANGAWTEYVVDLSTQPGWTGTITELRLDPASNGPTEPMAIGYIALWDSSTLPNPASLPNYASRWNVY